MNRSRIRRMAPASAHRFAGPAPRRSGGLVHGTLAAALALSCASGALGAQRPQEEGAPPAIEEKTASMERMDGFFPLYWEESAGRIWLEIGLWDTDVLHAAGIGAGLGSNDIGIDRGQQAGSRVVRFHRVGPKVLMIQPNYRFRASSDNPAERKAVEDAFARSTLWGFTVGAETGDRVLVDFTPFLLHDIAGFAGRLRPGAYGLDESRSAVYMPMVMNFPENTEMEASLTFVRQTGDGSRGPGGGRGAFEGVGDVAASGAAATVRVHHSLVKLPELGEYAPRAHNSRAGYGGMFYRDYSAPLGEPTTRRFIRRHRLEKRDPDAAMSEPVEPIVYYLDPGTPEPVRSALLDGARWWNRAFEAAGFVDAFRVELRPEGVSSHDVRYNVINWVHRSTRGWSTGGSITDPRTGEILKGTVTLGSLRVRQDYLIAEGLLAPYENGDEAPEDIAEWALARIRQLSAHEVGHTLGLSHNYYASDLGRISVLDYPHPLITHDGDRFDYSEVYDAEIGEWDKVAIRYGYSQFPPGADEAAELERILDEAWEDDIRFLTNQDVAAHARADQWSNGTDAGAELGRMLDVRRAALERFGERAIRAGRPMAQMEEVLVPLYLHHRYQVTSAASVLGGLHYTYARRGDGLDPVRPASAAEQRRALEALVRALLPAELTVPESVLDDLPPRPSGYGRTRELLPRYTGPMFDAISPAVVAAAHVVGEVLNGSRAARLLEQHMLDPSLPGLDEVIEALRAVGEPNAGDSPYEAEVRRAVGRVIADGLMGLAGGASMPQVRAVAARHLGLVKSGARNRTGLDDAAAAHFALLARDIQRFEDRPFDARSAAPAPRAPPGAPIGSAGADWPGARTHPAAGLLRGAGLVVVAGAGVPAWLGALAPACAEEGW
ncbi:MAG: zinc-dependent metalloprotease [Gemmatimonadota bacterium]|nr:zinc-dependent metalloprotease [Gemmatimonadota bacterium]